MLGQGLIFAVQQFYYRDSTVLKVKMVAPAHTFVSKRDTIRWSISLSVGDGCSRVEYRRLHVKGFRLDTLIEDSLKCVVEGDRFSFTAELRDEGANRSVKRIRGKNLPQRRDFLLSSLNYEYVPKGVKLWVLISPKRKLKFKVRFGYVRPATRRKMYELPEFVAQSDTVVQMTLPEEELSFGRVKFLVEVNGLTRESEALFQRFNLLNDRDWNILLSVLTFVFGVEEVKVFKDVEREKRREVWKEFWERRGGAKAEEEFMDRLYRAVNLFPSSFRNRISDRALIYVKYGPPDEVEAYPYRLSGKPYEIWYYYRLGKRFVFVDMDGTGDYRLVPESYLDFLR